MEGPYSMNENELRALQLTQEAVMRLISEVSERTIQKERVQELMTVGEVAQTLRISRWRLYHIYGELGLLPVKRFGRKLLFRRTEVMRLLERPEPRRGRPPNRLRMGDLQVAIK